MVKKMIAVILCIIGAIFMLTGSYPAGATSVTSTAGSPEILTVSISTNDYSASSPSGMPSFVPGTVAFGSFVGEERAINEALKVNVKTNGQWTMQIQAEKMTSTVPGEEEITLPVEQFQKRASIGIGSDTMPLVPLDAANYHPFQYDAEGLPAAEVIIENGEATGDQNGTQVNIGLKTLLTYGDLAREYASAVTVTTTAAY